MTGFTPPNWRPFAEVRDELGAERLGALLASGSVRSFYIDPWGSEKYLEATDWRRSTAREVMTRGLAFSRRRRTDPEFWPPDKRWVEETWPLFILAESLPAEHALPTAPSGARPVWMLADGQAVGPWARTREVQAEADRRIQERGERITQGRRATVMVEMAKEAGREAKAPSIKRQMAVKSGK